MMWALCAVVVVPGAGAQIAATPPMGWRNWNAFRGDIDQPTMQEQMVALAARKRAVVGLNNGSSSSLLDVGYSRAGLDDNWQSCGTGIRGSFHDGASGKPLVNTTRFPDMRAMVQFGHALGLKVGFYDNNCICGEGGAHLNASQIAKDVAGDAAFVGAMGFDGLKADGCGPGRNMTRLAELLRATGRDVLIENCHYFKADSAADMPLGTRPDPGRNRIWPYWRNNVTGGELVCPEHLFRASGDIRNSWGSWWGNLATLGYYQDAEHPISRPGCWAYADMLMVGVGESARTPGVGAAGSVQEWRSHFGGWCVNSSPLILSFDLTNVTVMDAVWPFITNLEAIAVNQAWAGHPGRALPLDPVTVGRNASAWAKPLPGGRVAVVLVSMRQPGTSAIDVDLSVPTMISPDLLPTSGVRDVWQRRDVGNAAGSFPIRNLEPHDSRFLIFSPSQ